MVILVLGAYWDALSGGFHFDDRGIFLDPYVVSPRFGWEIFRLTQTRPLTFLTFHWNFLVNGTAPEGFHLVNVAVHAINTALVFLIARRGFTVRVALLAGALFAVHPLQTQAVNYTFERATLLAALFALLCLLLFLQQRYSWAVATLGLSLLAKEETIALPAFLLLLDTLGRKHYMRLRYYVIMGAMAILAAARLFYALQVFPDAKLGFGKGLSPLSYALTQCRVVWTYLRLFVFPSGLTLDHDIIPSQGIVTPPVTLVALVLFVAVLGVLGYLAWRGSGTALWALGFFILLAPSSSFVPVTDLMFEHRTYFPLACLTIAAASLLVRMPVRLAAVALPFLVAALFVTTVARNRVWRDEESLWSDVVEKSPRKSRGYFQLAQVYATRDLGRARRLYERGLQIEPDSPVGHANLGLLMLWAGDPVGALSHFRQALAAGGEKALLWNNIGAARLRLGEIEEAVAAFRQALQSDPCRFDARINLLRALSYTGATGAALDTGQLPPGCHLLPEQVRELEYERRSLH